MVRSDVLGYRRAVKSANTPGNGMVGCTVCREPCRNDLSRLSRIGRIDAARGAEGLRRDRAEVWALLTQRSRIADGLVRLPRRWSFCQRVPTCGTDRRLMARCAGRAQRLRLLSFRSGRGLCRPRRGPDWVGLVLWWSQHPRNVRNGRKAE